MSRKDREGIQLASITLLAVVLTLTLLGLLQATGILASLYNTSSSEEKDAFPTFTSGGKQTFTYKDAEWDLDGCHIKVPEVTTGIIDYNGYDTILFTVEWTNNTSGSASPAYLSGLTTATQDDRPLDTPNYTTGSDVYDPMATLTEVQPGQTLTYKETFTIYGDSPVTLEMRSHNSDKSVSHKFVIKHTLG